MSEPVKYLEREGLKTIIKKVKELIKNKADLNENGLINSSQLPSYVDDVLEFESFDVFPIEGESGKIYVDTITNKTFRWSGSTYVEISASLTLGENDSTAFRGDLGKKAYEHSNKKGSSFPNGFYKITTNSEGHVTEAAEVSKQDLIKLGLQDAEFSKGFVKAYPSQNLTVTGTNDISIKFENYAGQYGMSFELVDGVNIKIKSDMSRIICIVNVYFSTVVAGLKTFKLNAGNEIFEYNIRLQAGQWQNVQFVNEFNVEKDDFISLTFKGTAGDEIRFSGTNIIVRALS